MLGHLWAASCNNITSEITLKKSDLNKVLKDNLRFTEVSVRGTHTHKDYVAWPKSECMKVIFIHASLHSSLDKYFSPLKIIHLFAFMSSCSSPFYPISLSILDLLRFFFT